VAQNGLLIEIKQRCRHDCYCPRAVVIRWRVLCDVGGYYHSAQRRL